MGAITRGLNLGNEKKLPEEMYDRLCRLLTDFENSTTDDTDEEWMSDGEWLDEFYDFCVDLKNSLVHWKIGL